MTVSGQFYLAQVATCARSAANATLTNERDKYLRAQAAWQTLADRERDNKVARDQREAERASQVAEIL